MRIRIKYRKLGKEKVWGLAHSDGVIEIEERLKGKKHLEIIVHEVLVHVDVGTQNLGGSVHNAARSRVPAIIVAYRDWETDRKSVV